MKQGVKHIIIFFNLSVLTSSLACSSTSTLKPTNKSNFSSTEWRTDKPPSIKEITNAVKTEQVEEKVEGMKNWWLYGPGMGRTILNIGTTIVFPPYGLFLLTNAGLSLAGEETIKPLEALPEEPKQVATEVYNGITSVPGRINAFLSEEEYIE